MDKNQFLQAASRLYDELFPEQAQPALFNKEEEPKKEIGPFKMRKEVTRVSTVAEHYGQPTAVFLEICKEVGISTLSSKKSGGTLIRREDVNFLVQYVERRYNNFNED